MDDRGGGSDGVDLGEFMDENDEDGEYDGDFSGGSDEMS